MQRAEAQHALKHQKFKFGPELQLSPLCWLTYDLKKSVCLLATTCIPDLKLCPEEIPPELWFSVAPPELQGGFLAAVLDNILLSSLI